MTPEETKIQIANQMIQSLRVVQQSYPADEVVVHDVLLSIYSEKEITEMIAESNRCLEAAKIQAHKEIQKYADQLHALDPRFSKEDFVRHCQTFC